MPPDALSDSLHHRAVAHLSGDAVFRPILDYVGPCGFRPRAGGFAALADIVIAQQVSKYAAESMRGKFRAAFGDPPDAAQVARARTERLRRCGLSGAKARYIRGLAREVAGGALDFGALHALDDGALRARLTAIKGIGAWTVEMYLIFVLGRPDIFPLGDGALRALLCKFYGLRASAKPARFAAIAERWAPYRSVASWYLYAWINRTRAASRAAKEAS